MKLTVFHAADGDCLLLESADHPPRRLLVDGGRSESFQRNTRGVLSGLDGGGLDVVCVSHIDDDHITGILRLVEDEVAWRAHAFRKTIDPGAKAPGFPRPPAIGEVWHNGLFRLAGDDTAPIVEEVLSTVATVLAGSPDPGLRKVASQLDGLATGERASMELTRRLSPEQLGIPLNPRSGGGLMKRGMADAPAPAEDRLLGGLRVRLLGPSDDDIDRLRTRWRAWISAHQADLQALQQKMLADEERLGTLSPHVVANPMLDQALGEGLKKVTEANLASIMLLVEEGAKSVLLTGDGVSGEILEGLKRHGKLDAGGRIHVSVLKVQHHGALANVEKSFVESVTADHYVFCGNGAHENPEIEVIEALANARLKGIDGGAPLGPATPFKFWFTSSPATPDDSTSKSRQKHMQAVKDRVAALRKGNTSRMTARFIKGGHFAITP